MNKAVSFREINEMNRIFWEKESALLLVRMADESLRSAAFQDLADEERRQVPVYSRMTLEAAAERAEKRRKDVLLWQSRKGGGARKRDSLQEFIEEIVARSPKITERELLAKLEDHKPLDPIVDIDHGVIRFKARRGIKEAPISGLKDRLSRAKKKRT